MLKKIINYLKIIKNNTYLVGPCEC